MLKLLVGRLGSGAVTLALVSLIIYIATIALPGDAAVAVLGKTATPESLAAFRAEHHLDQPVALRYLAWIGDLATGDFGTSVVSGEPAGELLVSRGLRTLTLMAFAVVIGFPLGTAIGVFAAVRRNSTADHAVSLTMLVITGIPEFALAVLTVLLLSTTVFQLFPAVSIYNADQPIFAQFDVLVLPILTLLLTILPYIALTIRSSMIEILDSDFVAMARLKGVPEGRVVLRHALANAAGPLIQVFAVTLVYMAGGAIIVETVFQFPGLGSALVEAVRNRDLVVVQATTLILAIVYIGVNILADLVVVALTPRLRTKVAA
ncbi:MULTISPECIES: ABC transporter permease [unclassified Shinella]|uniref:ABC transporter permease n=1 Tax=unclassified Shinella TaxID=2643062 RepID=UPI00225CB8A4|nr:ABC transporter permease [Shinella sp. YE25]MDC7258890.1 ABC transporter permease [Shinella sp. YE25]CAI0334333.1 ABC transmembrane type-1 domain-containing protein [Rhizobiaceae bacterium]CAK7260516.1 peptide/nickel transport system permease protein [Shinella sp. WSC3-e]